MSPRQRLRQWLTDLSWDRDTLRGIAAARRELRALHAAHPPRDGIKPAATLRAEALLWLRMGDLALATMMVHAARKLDPTWRLDMEHSAGPQWYECPDDDGWPGSQDVDPDSRADALYLHLKGARERLCVAQVLAGEELLTRELLGQAVERVDRAAVISCDRWSPHDRDHEL